MNEELYRRLAKHLDDLPGGFPETESGVEIKILRKLFTPEDAEMALALSIIEEEPRVVAWRMGITAAEAEKRLDEMEKKGLIYGTRKAGQPPRYMASQFVVGIWEYQIGRLDIELIGYFEEYAPYLLDSRTWKKTPQLRTVPVGGSVGGDTEILSYEKAEELVRAQTKFTVTPCICRTEMEMIGEGCGKPKETCLSFGQGADFYQRIGRGRAITMEEALEVLKKADKAGLVLSPGNERDAVFICACCGCCCGVLKTLKKQPKPGRLVSSPFMAAVDKDPCIGCGICIRRCQMDAVKVADRKASIDEDRCIGCGLCVTTCPVKAISLIRKREDEQPYVPKTITQTFIRLGKDRGKLSNAKLVRMLVKSKVDRLSAPKKI